MERLIAGKKSIGLVGLGLGLGLAVSIRNTDGFFVINGMCLLKHSDMPVWRPNKSQSGYISRIWGEAKPYCVN